jgi:hypothetical protein
MVSRRRLNALLGVCAGAVLTNCEARKVETDSRGHLTTPQFYQLMETVARGWNSNNARLAADCFSEFALYSAPPDPRIRRGRNTLFEFFGGPTGRPRPMRMTWHHLAFDENSQIGFGEYTFTYDLRTHGIVIVRIVGGHTANWREYEHPSPLDWEQMVSDNNF